MLSKLRAKLSFANVVSLAALFVALGGTAYATGLITGEDIQDGTIHSRDLTNDTIRGHDIRNDTIQSRDIQNGSLRKHDFKPGQFPQGGGGGKLTVRVNSDGLRATCSNDAGTTCEAAKQTLRATCKAGERATGGGWKGEISGNDTLAENRPDPESGTPTAWQVTVTKGGYDGGNADPNHPPNFPFSVYALCEA
jgi:hypothetical protein